MKAKDNRQKKKQKNKQTNKREMDVENEAELPKNMVNIFVQWSIGIHCVEKHMLVSMTDIPNLFFES